MGNIINLFDLCKSNEQSDIFAFIFICELILKLNVFIIFIKYISFIF